MKLEAYGAFEHHVHQKACNLANNTYILETMAQTVYCRQLRLANVGTKQPHDI
jgi:hypothetical protein